jgi:hypothetical protein
MLKLKHLLLAGVGLLALTPVVAGGPAFAGSSQTYAEVGNWNVEYNPDSNHCWMAQTFDRGTTIFLSRRQGVWTFAFGNPVWSERLEDGARYQITLILDGVDKWTDTFTARKINATEIGLYHDNVSVDFLFSMMKRYRVELRHHKSGETFTNVPLVNSYAAMLKLAECSNWADANGGYRPPQRQQPAPQRPQVREFNT